MAVDLPDYLSQMVRRPVSVAQVVPASTPVVAFGDPRQAAVASLGIKSSAPRLADGADDAPCCRSHPISVYRARIGLDRIKFESIA
jgi:hypothetical protein